MGGDGAFVFEPELQRAGGVLDPPNVLARIAKEMIQAAARQQADVTAELATRLDASIVTVVWPQQTAGAKPNQRAGG